MDQECKSKAQQGGLHTVDASEFLRRLGCIKPNSGRADDTLAAIQKEPGLVLSSFSCCTEFFLSR